MKNFKIIALLFVLFVSITACSVSNDNPDNQGNNTEITQNGNEYSVADAEDNSSLDDKIDPVAAIVIVVIVIIVVAFSFFFFKNVFPVGLWFKAWTAGVRVGIRAFLNMYFQKIPPDKIVHNLIVSRKAGVYIKVRQLEDFYLANVDIDKVVQGEIEAINASVDVTVDQLAKAYLAKIDIDKIIQAMILVQSADISTNFEELSQYYHSGVDIVRIVKAKITAKNSGFTVHFKDLAEHFLAGGNLDKTLEAYIAAKKADLKDFDFDNIADLDLAGYKVFEIIEKAIIPRVIEGDKVRGVARDGVEISMKLKVTLRAKLKFIIGNPEEATIIARINESLATEIGMAESHFRVLENPFELAERVEKKFLDTNTAFEILSIDVSDVTIGKDVHAELRSERARSDAQKAKADLIRAEEKLKKAIAAAFIDGKISINEYENIMNTQADTRMRNTLSNFDLSDVKDDVEEHHEDDIDGKD
ncbi:MAG: flotillin-like FloA family protein [Bacteroidales bacterium]|nr:flotillin-like FloA family protein [Bacteroidales bacterium]